MAVIATSVQTQLPGCTYGSTVFIYRYQILSLVCHYRAYRLTLAKLSLLLSLFTLTEVSKHVATLIKYHFTGVLLHCNLLESRLPILIQGH